MTAKTAIVSVFILVSPPSAASAFAECAPSSDSMFRERYFPENPCATEICTFVDLLCADYTISGNLASAPPVRLALVADLEFEAFEGGFPMIDLPKLSSFGVDRITVKPADQPAAVETALRERRHLNLFRLEKLNGSPPLPGPGRYHLRIEMTVVPGTGTATSSEVPNGYRVGTDGGLSIAYLMTDYVDGHYLERYLPANLPYDRVTMSVTLDVRGVGDDYWVIANADLVQALPPTRQRGRFQLETRDSRLHVRVEYPPSLNSASPWLHVTPDGHITPRDAPAPDGTEVFAYKVNTGTADDIDLEDFHEKVGESLERLGRRLGEFPHRNGLIALAIRPRNGVELHAMEYAGAMIARAGSPKNIRHELAHSYMGRGAFPTNGNAGWLDEVVAYWLEIDASPCVAAPGKPGSVQLTGFPPLERNTRMPGPSDGTASAWENAKAQWSRHFLARVCEAIQVGPSKAPPRQRLDDFLLAFSKRHFRQPYDTSLFESEVSAWTLGPSSISAIFDLAEGEAAPPPSDAGRIGYQPDYRSFQNVQHLLLADPGADDPLQLAY